jgi:alpha-beta hydrolase superfamily lysophospholipase
MSTFIGSQGRVHHDVWLPDGDVRGIVVLLHGYGEHHGLYDALARRLARDGHAVHAMDAVGHGRSDGERALIASWDHFVDDARQLVNLAVDRHPGRPVVIVGHSGGGAAAFLLALRSPGIAQALVLSGAPLRRVPWADELGEADIEVDIDPSEMFSTHPEYLHALLHDPLTWHGGFRPETVRALAATWPEMAAGLAEGRPDVPVLFVHGEDDPVVPVDDARANAAALPQAQLVVFPGDLHDVLNEHDRDVVHERVAAFVDASVALVPTSV